MEEQHGQVVGSPIYQESQQKNAKWLWLLIALIIIGAIVFAIVRGIGPFSALKGESNEEKELPTPTSEMRSPSPDTKEATEEAKLERNKPAIRVLNGSGIAGAASAFKDFLEGLGYRVVSVGNADEFEFDQTVIRFKEGFEDYGDLLVEDIKDDYSGFVSEEMVEATDSADIEITVGRK